MVRPETGGGPAAFADSLHPPHPPDNRGTPTVKVIASSLRKGNIVELDDGKLYVVLNAESFHPGKGTPTTQIDMRRISDGVKTAQRYKTTEQVERAHVEEQDFTFLYQDGDGFHFMNAENYDQITLQAGHGRRPGRLSGAGDEGQAGGLRGRAGFDRAAAEGDPRSGGDRAHVKSQTAASSYKPAVLSNGVRTMVPPFVGVGTKIVVMTADGSYVERAKE